MVEVSMNGVDYTHNQIRFDFYVDPVVEYIFPTLGSTAGGTIVELVGRNFLDVGSDFHVKFGSTKSPATYINSLEIRVLQ